VSSENSFTAFSISPCFYYIYMIVDDIVMITISRKEKKHKRKGKRLKTKTNKKKPSLL
jgi:hypothetical protein